MPESPPPTPPRLPPVVYVPVVDRPEAPGSPDPEPVRATLDVAAGVLDEVSASLLRAAEALDGAGSSAPTEIDAGPWTALITAMVSRVGVAAAGASAGLARCGAAVLDAQASFAGVDEAVHDSFTPRGGAGEP